MSVGQPLSRELFGSAASFRLLRRCVLVVALSFSISLTGCAGVLPTGESHPLLGQGLSLLEGAERERGRLLLVLVWSTSCERCRDWAVRVEQVARSGRLSVLGVLSHSDEGEARRLVSELSLGFGQVVDLEGVFLEQLQLKRVPVLLLLDAEGVLCFVSRERLGLEELERLLARLDALPEGFGCR